MIVVYSVIIALYGLLFGSFFNVVGLRVPVGESFVTPPSHCPSCQSRLLWYELIPVFSWVALAGRCRTCHSPISYVYPLMEAMTGVFAVLLYLRFGLTIQSITGWIVLSVLAMLSVADLHYYKLPNKILFPGIVLLILLRLWFHPLGYFSYASGAIVGYVILYAILVLSRGGMGFGDVKLFLFIGLFVGMSGMLLTLMLASLIGLLTGMALRVAGRIKARQKVAFGPSIALAVMIVYLYGQGWIEGYLQLLHATP